MKQKLDESYDSRDRPSIRLQKSNIDGVIKEKIPAQQDVILVFEQQ